MKTKYYLIILAVVFMLFIYNVFCYSFANRSIDEGTNYIIKDYLKKECNNCDFKYKYKMATTNSDGTINVFIKTESKYLKDYYRFIFLKNGGYYLINVNNNIPPYIS